MLLFALLGLLVPIPAHAQEPGPTTWEWRTFTAANSPLAPGDVKVLLEDSLGRIWVGTSYYDSESGIYKSGVSLYDGGAWQTFTADNSPLPPGEVTRLLEDSKDRIWVGTGYYDNEVSADKGGVSFYQDGAWQTFTAEDSPLVTGEVEVLLEDSQGRIWVGTSYGLSLYQAGTWQTFTAENSSLVSGRVNELLGDSQGHIWVGTSYGVSLYQDGAWQTFTADNSPLVLGGVRQLLEDSQGRIWAGTGRGVSLYQDGAWQTFTAENSPLAPGWVARILEDSLGRVWVGTNYHDSEADIPRWGGSFYQNGIWQTFTAENFALASDWITQILEDAQGRIWVGTHKGISLYQAETWQTFTAENSPLALAWVTQILEDSLGRIWVGTSQGVSLYQMEVWQTFTVENSPLAPGSINEILEDSQSRIWVGTSQGLSLYQEGAWQTFTAESSLLASGWVNEILEDAQRRIWVGTGYYDSETDTFRSGISFYQADAWHTFTAENSSLAPGEVYVLLEDSEGRIWVGTGDEWLDVGGVSLYQAGAWQTFTAESSPLAPGRISEILEDSGGRIWVGTYYHDSETDINRGGVSLYQADTWQTFTAEDSPLAPGGVWKLLADSQDHIWVGTSHGVSLYQDGIWQTFTAEDSPLAPGRVNELLEDSQGHIWIGTDEGLSLYRADIWQTLTAEDSPLAPGRVMELLEDSRGRVWVGTSEGVSLYQEGTWQTFTAEDSPLAPGGVNELLEDFQGHIWIGTSQGVSLYQEGAWQTFTAANFLLAPGGWFNPILEDSQGRIWVTTSHGMSLYHEGIWQIFTTEDSPRAPSGITQILEDSQGRIWVGTLEGLSMRRPSGDRPCAFLRYIGLALGQTTSLQATAVLTFTFPTPHSTLIVGFSGIDAESDPDRLLFRCQLVGYEDEEVPCASPVRYPALPPGTYTFRVRALDEDLMSSEPATATITLISTAPPTPTPTRASTPTPYVVEVEHVVPGLPKEVVIPLAGGLGGLVVAIMLGVMIRGKLRRMHALRRGFNPYQAGRPILDPHRFFGREALIAQVLNTIHQNDVLIHGERRIGKTSLLRQLEHRLREMDDPDYRFIPVYVDIEGVSQAEFFHTLMEEIASMSREAGYALPALRFANSAAAEYDYRDFMHDLQSLLDALQAASPRAVRLILLLDEVDAMNGYDQLVQQQFRRILMKRFARQVGIVASGVHVFREWSRQESPFRNLFVEIHLDPLEEQDARRLITEPVRGIYDYNGEAVDLILHYSERKPWRIQRLCLEVVNRLLVERRTRATGQDVEDVYRHVLAEEAQSDAVQGEYPALVPAPLSVAEAKTEYQAKPGEDSSA